MAKSMPEIVAQAQYSEASCAQLYHELFFYQTAAHEEENAKGSFYFKVFGKELFYNYFTYDDVKELIEDGVIRVSNDLKDLLKKGWEKNESSER